MEEMPNYESMPKKKIFDQNLSNLYHIYFVLDNRYNKFSKILTLHFYKILFCFDNKNKYSWTICISLVDRIGIDSNLSTNC